MDNDLNTSMAITTIYDVCKSDLSDATKRGLIEAFDTVLSLGLTEAAERKRAADEEKAKKEAEEAALAEANKDDFDREIEALIAERAAAKKAKNYARADEIRADLLARGVTLIDTPKGTTYQRS